MNILQGINQAIEYLEENMQGEIDYQRAAAFTGYSSAYFQRIFTCIAQITVVEYVRKRRMTLAAAELKDSNIKIVDLAVKYGYNSADAFTKAFLSFHGVTPSQARETAVTVKSFSPLRFHISVEGSEEMKYRILESKPLRVVGLQKHYVAPENNEQDVDSFWNEIFSNGMYEKLLSISDRDPYGVHGFMQVIDDTHVDYMIGVVTDHEVIKGTTEYIVPASTWAIFEKKGAVHDTIGGLWKQIFDEWLPALEYQHAQTTEIECFPYDDNRGERDFRYEIWIPVVKKV